MHNAFQTPAKLHLVLGSTSIYLSMYLSIYLSIYLSFLLHVTFVTLSLPYEIFLAIFSIFTLEEAKGHLRETEILLQSIQVNKCSDGSIGSVTSIDFLATDQPTHKLTDMRGFIGKLQF